jgi:hypothetical protein
MESPPLLKKLYAFLTIFPFSFTVPFLVKLAHTPRVFAIRPYPTSTAQTLAPANPVSRAEVLQPIPRHYTQPEIDFMLEGTKNSYDLKKLIQCESQNTNIARMDSNNVVSYGILQFNGTATWSTFAPLAGVSSRTPMNPQSAIMVADWMISHGELHRWTCAKIQNLF